MRRRFLIRSAALLVLLPSGLAAGGIVASASSPRAVHPHTQPGEIDVVQTAGHSKDLWVITDQSNSDYNVARQHHGTWRTLPATQATDDGQLLSMTAPTASAVWVAGEVHPKNREQPAIFRWNGSELVKQALPDLTLQQSKSLSIDSISAVSAKDAWAVSDSTFAGRDAQGHPTRPVALHWTKKKWRAVRVPQPFFAVVDLSRTNAWAIGTDNDLYHWNGDSWKHDYTVPAGDELRDIAASSPHNIVAVGDNNARTGDEEQNKGTYIVRYDGTQWSRMTITPKLKTPAYLTNVTVAGDSAWAIAFVPNSSGLATTIFHTSGDDWKVQQTLDNDVYLADISASAATRVFAAGNFSGASVGGSPTYLKTYDGNHWKQIASKF